MKVRLCHAQSSFTRAVTCSSSASPFETFSFRRCVSISLILSMRSCAAARSAFGGGDFPFRAWLRETLARDRMLFRSLELIVAAAATRCVPDFLLLICRS